MYSAMGAILVFEHGPYGSDWKRGRKDGLTMDKKEPEKSPHSFLMTMTLSGVILAIGLAIVFFG